MNLINHINSFFDWERKYHITIQKKRALCAGILLDYSFFFFQRYFSREKWISFRYCPPKAKTYRFLSFLSSCYIAKLIINHSARLLFFLGVDNFWLKLMYEYEIIFILRCYPDWMCLLNNGSIGRRCTGLFLLFYIIVLLS